MKYVLCLKNNGLYFHIPRVKDILHYWHFPNLPMLACDNYCLDKVKYSLQKKLLK